MTSVSSREITLRDLWNQIEDLAVGDGPQQLDVLGMGPT